MINLPIIESIRLAEVGHELSILLINSALEIPLSDMMALQSFGKVTIAVDTPNEASFLIGKLSGYQYKIVLTRRIPIVNYDVLISNTFEGTTSIVVRNMHIKYVCFTNFVKNFNLTNYYEFEQNAYKLYRGAPCRPRPIPTSGCPCPPHGPLPPPPLPPRPCPCPPIPPTSCGFVPPMDQFVGDTSDGLNSASNYEMIVKDVAAYDVKYDKYRINYLNRMVPGKVSIVMIVSNATNKFADTLRELRAQNVASIEYIIIDNAAGFRNNVKPNIRYGEKMPIDYCEYHAKELTTGEFIFILNEDTDTFDIMTAINQGKYETR